MVTGVNVGVTLEVKEEIIVPRAELRLSTSVLVGMLTDGYRHYEITEGVPLDAELTGVMLDERGYLLLELRHPSFVEGELLIPLELRFLCCSERKT